MRELNQPAPIVLFCFNRPKHTAKTISALAKNYLAATSDLYIFCDGPRSEEDMLSVTEVYSIVENVVGFRNVYIRKSQHNKGLADSVIAGVTEIVQLYGRVIVLEDDLVTSPYFLEYMNDALKLYLDEERVVSIHAYCYPVKAALPETFFLRGADCWGWATWKRGWELFNSDGQFLLDELQRLKLTHLFDFNGAYQYTEMLKNQINGNNESWAVRWYASAFLADKLTLYPWRSLVHNIGNDNSGTHCGISNSFDVVLDNTPINLSLIKVEPSPEARQEFEVFLRQMKTGLMRRLLGKLSRLLRQVGKCA
jgi:hypothetical protein